jgi:hypothetical protein
VPDGHRRYRQLREQGVETQVTLVDPDVVESSNIFRQNFSAAEIGRNKAETLAVRLSAAWGLEIHAQPAPFRSAMVTDGYGRFTVVIGCVDNAAARRQQRQRWIQIRARRIGRLYPDLIQDPVVLARLAKTPLCPACAQRLVRTSGLRREARFNLQPIH